MRQSCLQKQKKTFWNISVFAKRLICSSRLLSALSSLFLCPYELRLRTFRSICIQKFMFDRLLSLQHAKAPSREG